MKKALCVFLAFLTAVSVLCISISAAEEEPVEEKSVLTVEDCENLSLDQIFYLAALGKIDFGEVDGAEGEEPDAGGEEGEVPEEKEYDPNHVADFYLMSNASGFPSLGHIWIYIDNVSPRDLQVGCYTCPPGEGVSVGCFGLTRSDGFGVYYNIESYCGNLFPEKLKKCYRLKTEMNEEQANKVSNKILHSNWWDPMVVNCVFFALSSWNKAGGRWRFPWTCFPAIAKVGIKRDGVPGVDIMIDPGRDRVFKQKGSGSKAVLKPVKDGSVDTVPG